MTFSKSDPPEVPDPLIQFMVGHPQRGSLRWLGAEACFQAIEPDLPPLAEEIIYDNGGAADPMDPEDTRLTPATVRRILLAYLHTGSRPQDITWIPLL